MNAYVSSLKLTGNETSGRAAEISVRLLCWLQNLNESVYLSTATTNAVLQAAAILQYFTKRFGDPFYNELVIACFGDSANPAGFFIALKEQTDGELLRYFSSFVLRTRNGARHAAIVLRYQQRFLHGIVERHRYEPKRIVLSLSSSAVTPLVRNEARHLLERIFQLKNADISIAIGRLIDFQYSNAIRFDHVAAIVCETAGRQATPFYRKSLLFTTELNRRLSLPAIRPNFLQSIDKELLFHMLATVATFRRSFITFIVDCLADFRYDAEFEMFVSSGRFHEIGFHQVEKVIGLLLNGPVLTLRRTIYRAVKNIAVDPVLLDYFIEQKFIRHS